MLKLNDTATDRAPRGRDDTVRQAAQQLVASTLLLPLMQQMRQDPFRGGLFHGGRAEEMFNQQLDTILADRMSQSMNLPVVDAVQRSLTRRLHEGKALDPAEPHRRTLDSAAPWNPRLDLHG